MKVVAGAVFDIALGCSPSTGYMWQPNPLPDGVVLLGSEFAAPANAQVGDAGQQVFHLCQVTRDVCGKTIEGKKTGNNFDFVGRRCFGLTNEVCQTDGHHQLATKHDGFAKGNRALPNCK